MLEFAIKQMTAVFLDNTALVKRESTTIQASLACNTPQELSNDELPVERAAMGTLGTWYQCTTAVPTATVKIHDRLTISGQEYILRQFTPWPSGTSPDRYRAVLETTA